MNELYQAERMTETCGGKNGARLRARLQFPMTSARKLQSFPHAGRRVNKRLCKQTSSLSLAYGILRPACCLSASALMGSPRITLPGSKRPKIGQKNVHQAF